MDETTVIKALAALAQPVRLQVFRALVVAGQTGMTPGTMAQGLGVAPNALSFHLKDLVAEVERMFLTIMNRKPTMNEKDIAKRVLGAGEDGYANMIWALINTREFMFVQ